MDVFAKNPFFGLWKGHKYASAFVRNGLRIISLRLLTCYNNAHGPYWQAVVQVSLLHCSYYILYIAVNIIPASAKTIRTFSFLFLSSFFHSCKNKVKYSAIDYTKVCRKLVRLIKKCIKLPPLELSPFTLS